MASISPWDPHKILHLYLHDYMIKRGMRKTAEIFQKEAEVCHSPVVIDSPDGFLHEWWSIFYEVFLSRQGKDQETEPDSSSKVVPEMTDNATKGTPPRIPQPQISMITSERRPQQFQVSSSFNKTMAQPAACLLPSTVNNKENLGYLTKEVDPNVHINANNLKLLAGTSSNHPPQDVGKQAQKQVQKQVLKDCGIGILMEGDVPIDPLDLVQRTIQPLGGPHETKADEALNLAPLNGWPLNNQVLASLLQAPNYQQQYQLMDQMIRTVEHQCQQDQQQQQQSQNVENSRKRKTTVSLRAGESASDCVDAADGKSVDENVESFLSIENEHADQRIVPFSNLKRISATSNTNESKGFSFEEVGCLHSSKSKVLSCHFSSDGKVLASAGHEKKVFIWNMETFDCVTTLEAHSHLITDVRFRPSSTIFATSSFDGSVKIWDAARPTRSLFKLNGHGEQVMSLDFHPRKVDLLCSCDSNDIVRLWDVNQRVCMHTSKGGSKQVRFQPRLGKFLATATGNNIRIVDVETDSLLYHLKGHVNDVLSICWDISGNYIASVSEDSAHVWSAVSEGKCIHELHSNGNKFQSCIFHPGYLNLLIIGGYQSLEVWSPTESSKTWTIPAHKGLIAGLADSHQNELIASASHDHCVKLWK